MNPVAAEVVNVVTPKGSLNWLSHVPLVGVCLYVQLEVQSAVALDDDWFRF